MEASDWLTGIWMPLIGQFSTDCTHSVAWAWSGEVLGVTQVVSGEACSDLVGLELKYLSPFNVSVMFCLIFIFFRSRNTNSPFRWF